MIVEQASYLRPASPPRSPMVQAGTDYEYCLMVLEAFVFTICPEGENAVGQVIEERTVASRGYKVVN
jgi:hypothetical protein